MCAADISNLVLDFPLGLCHYVQTVRGKGHHLEAESSSRCRFIKESAMAKGSKYTEEMVSAIEGAASVGPLNLEVCTMLAEQPIFAEAGITARGIVAKARTLGLPYQKVVRTTKDGRSIVRKDEMVTRLEEVTGLSGLDGLEKANKEALRRLVDHLVATVA
jgi:hypothetical protein